MLGIAPLSSLPLSSLPAAAGTLTLDLITPQPTLAVSVARKLRTAYAGSCLRIRRSSDDTEQDIGFSSNNMDESSLTTFVGANNGFIQRLYSQGANDDWARNTTNANQPQLVSSGTVLEDSGNLKPNADFDGVNQVLLITDSSGTSRPASDIITAAAFTIFVVCKIDVFNTSVNPYDGGNIVGDRSGGSSYHGIKVWNSANLSIYNWDGAQQDIEITGAATGTRYQIESRHESGNLYIKTNTIGETSGASGDTQSLATQYSIGDIFDGKIQEVIVYNTALSSGDRSTILADIVAYYADVGGGALPLCLINDGFINGGLINNGLVF